MITFDTVLDVFSHYITGESIKISEHVTVPVSVFVSLFEGTELSYDALINKDGEELGYNHFFDRCREQGILN